jgi:hypothetical protein
MVLQNQVGKRLTEDFQKYLSQAKTHRKGTKVRLDKILRFVYHYGNYAHECLIEGGAEVFAKHVLKSFWESFSYELKKYRDNLDDFQIHWLLKLGRESTDLGIEVDRELISSLEDIVRNLTLVILTDPMKKYILSKSKKRI